MVQQLNIPTACNEIIVKEFEVVKEVIGLSLIHILYAAKNSMFSFFQNQELNGAISGTNDESSYKSKYNTEG